MGPAFGRGLDSVHPSERPQLQYHRRSPRQYLRSLKGFDDIRHGWDPGPHHLYHSAELGGPGPPSGPAHQARASHPHPGLRHLQSHQLQRPLLHSSCHLPPGFRGLCMSGTPFRGILHYIRGIFIRSHSMMSRHLQLIPGSGIP